MEISKLSAVKKWAMIGLLAFFGRAIANVPYMREEGCVTRSDKASPVWLKVFWGFSISLLAFVLLYSGGLEAVQTASIIMGLPMLILIIIMCYSAIVGLKKYGDECGL
ncbi:BCCT family transporter [Clostridium sp. Marseille-P2415]|uniref:BCCT family transporter n=1 Tax=Clostridium sp. Marseille-P2415 TaxID=1805471 RepID=UPI00098886DF|nr:BCCT family transporter [Clostridium sp. Marseille-P2415]